MSLLTKVITNNTGVSSKSFIMIMGMFLSIEVTQVMLVLTIWNFITTRTLDYTGISLLLTALGGLIAASAYGKIKVDSTEANNPTTPIVD